MDIHNVGPDELDAEIRIRGAEKTWVWVVYWYEQGSYEGSGELVALGADGLLDTYNLGHCSCYGPLDDFGGSTPTTALEFLREPDSVHDDVNRPEVVNKVRELLQ